MPTIKQLSFIPVLMLLAACSPTIQPTTVYEKSYRFSLNGSILVIETPDSMESFKNDLEAHIVKTFSAENCKFVCFQDPGPLLNKNPILEFAKEKNINQVFVVTVSNATKTNGWVSSAKVIAKLYNLSANVEIWKSEIKASGGYAGPGAEGRYSESISQSILSEIKKSESL